MVLQVLRGNFFYKLRGRFFFISIFLLHQINFFDLEVKKIYEVVLYMQVVFYFTM